MRSVGGGTDKEFLKQERDKMSEYKDFVEQYLNLLFATDIEIQDKEKKIEMILQMQGQVSEILDKYLVLAPFSPRHRADERKKKEETKEETKEEPVKHP